MEMTSIAEAMLVLLLAFAFSLMEVLISSIVTVGAFSTT
jgi:hypothetical protein